MEHLTRHTSGNGKSVPLVFVRANENMENFMIKLALVCLLLFLSACATNPDFQPKKESVAELGGNYKEIQAKLAAGKKYQDMSPEAQIEYIQNFKEYKVIELLINSNKISDETTRQYLLSLKTLDRIKKAIQESPSTTINSKSELIEEIRKTESFYGNYLYVPSKITKVWIIMQNHGPLIDGSSNFYEFTDRRGLIANFDKYLYYARKNNKRLVITASNSDESAWYQENIKYKGSRLNEVLYRSPDQQRNFFGVEVPLDQ